MSVEYPDTLHYTKDHEWIRIEGEDGVVGISDYAQNKLLTGRFAEPEEIARIIAFVASQALIIGLASLPLEKWRSFARSAPAAA